MNKEARKETAMDHPDKLGAGAEKRRHVKDPKEKIGIVMAEFKRGTLHSSAGPKVHNRKQALAIALSEANRAELEKKLDHKNK